MKRTLAISVVALLVVVVACSRDNSAVCPQARPAGIDWSWTFQRDGETYGLLFEDTSLTASIKAAIRDDVSWSYSLATPPSRFTKIYAPGHPQYGIFVGVDGIEDDYGCAEELSEWKYKLHNGNKYFHVNRKLSTRFLEAIALTNQHQIAAGSLSNFLSTVNNVTTNNAMMADYITYWWSIGRKRMLTMDDFPKPGDFLKFITPYCNLELLAPSILNFKYGERELDGELCYEIVFRNRHDGEYKRSAYDLIFKSGQWRIVLPFY